MQPLSIGTQGDAVAALQQSLAAVGLVGGTPTGVFDPTTQRAVIEAQRRAGLPQTGVVDDSTWNALYQMQSSVSAASDVSVATAGVTPDTAVAGPSRGTAILLAIGVGLATYWANKKFSGGSMGDDEEDDKDDEDDGEDIDFEPPRARMSDLDDAVTDSLLDEPAVIASSRKPGDCKKAARMLLSRSGLAQRPAERALYNKVVRKVANDCAEQQEAVQEAVEDVIERQEEIEDMLDVRAEMETERIDTAEGARKRQFVAPGFRKTKNKWTKKGHSARKTRRTEISPGEQDILDSIAHAKKPNRPGAKGGGRPGASAIRVKKRGGEQYRIRKEKAKTKRGHTWRRED